MKILDVNQSYVQNWTGAFNQLKISGIRTHCNDTIQTFINSINCVISSKI
jgi:hypothetical protein